MFKEQPDGFIFIATKDQNGTWRDYAFKTVSEAEAFAKTQENVDIYFSPTTYSKDVRKKPYVQPSKWLWQDLDEVNPNHLTPKPTIAWETSPGRYQALWKLPQALTGEALESVNRDLARITNADHGSWILTKVLRIPGTKNFKYPGPPSGKLLWTDGPDYHAVPPKVLDVLEKTPTVGNRSDALWLMEHELAKAGFSMEEIYKLVKASQWNKYKGRSDEEERLMHEIALAMKDQYIPPAINFKVDLHSDIMSNMCSEPGWLVEGWWSQNSHGIIAGEPKSFKSTLAFDLAISVASGEPFLGQYEVKHTGPVIIVQNENADWIIKERMGLISAHRGLAGNVKSVGAKNMEITWPDPLPIYYVNNQGFSFSSDDHRKQLEALVQEVKPILIIFDPLYLMFDGDVNSAKDLNPALNYLLYLKNTYSCSIAVIHHWRKSKGSADRGGQRMLGSTTLHGWVESAWYVQAGEFIEIEREFRAAEQPPKLKLKIGMDSSTGYSVELVDSHGSDILEFVASHPKGVKMQVICESCCVKTRDVQKKIKEGVLKEVGDLILTA